MEDGTLTPEGLNKILGDLSLPQPPVGPPEGAVYDENMFFDDPKPSNAAYGVFPESFGAKGDGKTDDTNAILQAIDLAKKTKMPLYFTGGKRYIFTPVKDTDITGIPEFIGYATIDCSKVDQTKVKTIFAVTGSSSNLTTSARLTKSENSFNVGSGKNVKVGDILYVISKEANGNPDRDYYYKGQLFTVFDYNSSSGLVTTFETINQSINAGSVDVSTNLPLFKCDSNLTFTTAKDNWIYCFKFIKANVDVQGNFYFFANAAIYIQYTIARCSVNVYYSYLSEQDDSNRTCYGIVITDLSRVVVTDSYIIGGRHAVSGTGNYPVEYQINGGFYANLERVGSVDAHGNAWSIQVNGATILGGYQSSACINKVADCIIYYRGASGVQCIHIATTDYSWGVFIFSNCNITSLGTVQFSGIITDAITSMTSLSMLNCSIVSTMESGYSGYAFRVKDNVGAVYIDGLNIAVVTEDTGMICMLNVYTDNTTINNINVNGTSFRIYNKMSGTASRIFIENSSFELSPNVGLWVQDFENLEMHNVRANNNAQTGIYCQNNTYAHVRACIARNNGAGSISGSASYDYYRAGLAMKDCDEVSVTNNIFRSTNSTSAGVGQCFGAFLFGTIGNFILQMNNARGCKGTSTNRNSFITAGTKLSQLGNVGDFPIPDSLNT